MKHITSKLVMAACFMAGISSCSDSFLEAKKDYNNMTTLDVFSDKTQANAAFAIFYKQILKDYSMPIEGSDILMRHGAANNGGQLYILADEWPGKANNKYYDGSNSKESKAGNHMSNPPYWNNPMNNASNFNNFDKRILFPTIYQINNFIKQIELSRDLIADNQFWDRLKGQAIFTRAWLYFDAVRINGGLPYYSTETDEPQMGDRSTRMPVQECIDKICADFQTAANLLPPKWEDEANDGGRFTSVAAMAMISRVRLYAASPVFNASWDNPSGSRWQAALDAALAAKEAADAAGYGTSVTDIESWDRAFYGYSASGSMSFNPEAIIKIPRSWTVTDGAFYNDWENQIRPGVVMQNNNAGVRVSELMLSKFPMASGLPATPENGYDDTKFYRDRDPRFYRTFAFSGCQWPGTETQLWLYAYKYKDKVSDEEPAEFRYTDGTQNNDGAKAKSRAIVWKMTNPAVKLGNESTNGTDILEYRYAELLLNIAECYAAKGDGQCIAYLRQIRNRVGAGTQDLERMSNDRYTMLRAVLNERAVELAYEGKRSWDMRRWLLYEGGAGFDPQLAGYNSETHAYDSDAAYGAGWHLYNGQNGRENYTKTNNVLSKLDLEPFNGIKSHTKIWGWDLDEAKGVDVYEGGVFQHPLQNEETLLAVTPITRDMNPADRNAAFDKLEAFYNAVGMQTIDPLEDQRLGDEYAMDSGTKETDKNYLFAFRGWYYVYPIHYDMYTEGKGNTWLTQTEGWMTANASPTGSPAEQDGTYVYCTPE